MATMKATNISHVCQILATRALCEKPSSTRHVNIVDAHIRKAHIIFLGVRSCSSIREVGNNIALKACYNRSPSRFKSSGQSFILLSWKQAMVSEFTKYAYIKFCTQATILYTTSAYTLSSYTMRILGTGLLSSSCRHNLKSQSNSGRKQRVSCQ